MSNITITVKYEEGGQEKTVTNYGNFDIANDTVGDFIRKFQQNHHLEEGDQYFLSSNHCKHGDTARLSECELINGRVVTLIPRNRPCICPPHPQGPFICICPPRPPSQEPGPM